MVLWKESSLPTHIGPSGQTVGGRSSLLAPMAAPPGRGVAHLFEEEAAEAASPLVDFGAVVGRMRTAAGVGPATRAVRDDGDVVRGLGEGSPVRNVMRAAEGCIHWGKL